MTTFSRPSPTTGLLVGLGLLLAACGGAAADTGPDAGASREPGSIAEGEPAPGTDAPAAEEPTTDAPDADEPVSDAKDDADAPDAPAPAPAPAADEDADCSAHGQTVTIAPATGLPDEVAALRELLIDAALRCDEQLLFTAMEESDQFNFTFGTESDALGMWWELEEAGEAPFLRLAQVLATTPALADGGEIHVWPRVATGRAEDTTEAAWQEATWLQDPAAAAAQGDGYLDWRVGISTDGQWRFFVRGD